LRAPKLVGVVAPMAFLGTSPAVPGIVGWTPALAVGRIVEFFVGALAISDDRIARRRRFPEPPSVLTGSIP